MADALSAASTHHIEGFLFVVLLQLVVIILVARAGGSLARQLGQPRAVGEIVVGMMLGPSLFGLFFPEISDQIFHSVSSTPITIISQIGLILLMFQIGMDFDFSHLKDSRNRKAVSLIAFACLVLPFILGFALGKVTAASLAPATNPLPYALFLGTTLSITGMPILGRIMMEFNLTRTQVGAITISSAAINDVGGWLLLAVISSLSTESFSVAATVKQFALLGLYGLVFWYLVKPGLIWLISRFDVTRHYLPPNLMALMLVMIFVSGMLTYKIGIFAIFGGFLVGVLVHEQSAFAEAWKKFVGTFVLVFFLPVFFTYTGLRTDITGLNTLALWQWCMVITLAACIGKFGGAYLGARIAGLDSRESSTIAIMMNTRALMALIVLNIGFDLGFIPQQLFTMLVIMAVFTTLITAPVLRHLLEKMGHVMPQGIDA